MFAVVAVLAVSGLLAFTAMAEPGTSEAGSPKQPDKETAGQQEVAGKVVSITPCRTMMEVEVTQADGKGKPTRMQFLSLDPEARESAKGVSKGDTVTVRYVFSPDTQRNRVAKVTKVAAAGEPTTAAATKAEPPKKQARKGGAAQGTVTVASATQLKLKTDAGEEFTFNVLPKIGEQAKALKKDDKVAVTYSICPGGCCPHPWAISVKKL
jgi:hypothetical protein